MPLVQKGLTKHNHTLYSDAGVGNYQQPVKLICLNKYNENHALSKGIKSLFQITSTTTDLPSSFS